MTSEEKIAALEAKNAALEQRLAEVEKRTAPPKPFVSDWRPPPNPIDRATMPASAQAALVNGVGESVMADIRGDVARGERGRLPLVGGGPRPGNGFVAPSALEVPGGEGTQRLVERVANRLAPHAPMHGKPREEAK